MKGKAGHTANDVKNLPAYPLAEAARYARVPRATLATWVPGLIKPASAHPPTLSFLNLVEAHVLRALRMDHGVPMPAVRKALAYAERELGIRRLLLSEELSSNAGKVFLERYGQLINLSQSGQLAMESVLQSHLRRVEWDKSQLPVRLRPFVPGISDNQAAIAIDPAVQFGRPIIASHGISTAAITRRLDAGESTRDLMADYGITEDEILQAVLYERAA